MTPEKKITTLYSCFWLVGHRQQGVAHLPSGVTELCRTQDAVILVVGDGNWYMHFPLTQTGATPLYMASQNGHGDVVNILIRNGADVNLSWEVS